MTHHTARLRLPRLAPLLLALLLPALLGGCDTSPARLSTTDGSFSLFGLLDADDQQHAVRVEALQDGKPFGADSVLDASVTLTHVESDRTVTLEHRLFGKNVAHNYVTEAMDLRLNDTYRLAVQPAEGKGSTATLTMPRERPTLSLSQNGMVATVKGGTEDQLLYLRVEYHTTVELEPCIGDAPCVRDRVFSLRRTQRARRTESGYTASFDWIPDVDSLYSGQKATVTLRTVTVHVGLVHSNAPTYEGLTREELFRPGAGPSNVENGYGYVAGVTSDEASFTFPPRPPRPTTLVPLP